MSSKGGLLSRRTSLVYIPHLGKL